MNPLLHDPLSWNMWCCVSFKLTRFPFRVVCSVYSESFTTKIRILDRGFLTFFINSSTINSERIYFISVNRSELHWSIRSLVEMGELWGTMRRKRYFEGTFSFITDFLTDIRSHYDHVDVSRPCPHSPRNCNVIWRWYNCDLAPAVVAFYAAT